MIFWLKGAKFINAIKIKETVSWEETICNASGEAFKQ
jgi:hypothetical protein